MKVSVAYSSSDSYMKCTGVSILSLFENNQAILDLDVYIITSDISEDNKRKIQTIASTYNRIVEFVDASDKLKIFVNNTNFIPFRGSYQVYIDLILDKLVLVDKLLVIDSDTIITESIIELWETNIDDYLIAAVPEIGLYAKKSSSEEKDILYKHEYYFNTGVLLYNLKRWKNENITEFLKSHIVNDNITFKIYDQSIINYYLNNKILRLNLKFNYYTAVHGISYAVFCKIFSRRNVFTELEFVNARKEPVIIHFVGFPFERPWYEKGTTPYKLLYCKYLELTPWAGEPLETLPKNKSIIMELYFLVARYLRKFKFYNFYHYFRYIIGQEVKHLIYSNKLE